MKLTDTLNATAVSNTQRTDPASGELKKDDFLRLLTTQMAQQDPMNPMDNQQFVAQLSQMATVERLENLSSSVESMALAQSANTSAQVVSFIGQDVRVRGDEITVEEGVANEVGYTLDSEADTVQVTVRNDEGKVVATVEVGGNEAGKHSFTWDGKDENGNTLPDGDYTYDVSAEHEGDTVSASTHSVRRVRGITFAEGFPRLMLDDDNSATLGDVIEVVDKSEG